MKRIIFLRRVAFFSFTRSRRKRLFFISSCDFLGAMMMSQLPLVFFDSPCRVHLSDKVNEAGTKFLIVKKGEKYWTFFLHIFLAQESRKLLPPKHDMRKLFSSHFAPLLFSPHSKLYLIELATSKKSTIFVQSSWNLVKIFISWGIHFDQVSWGLDKRCGFFTCGQFLNVGPFFWPRPYFLMHWKK